MLNPRLRMPETFPRDQSFAQGLSAEEPQLVTLRRLTWLYFALLIGEGILRKWIVPSLSAPLLVIRDPVALLIYVQALRCRRFPVSRLMAAYFMLLSGFVLLVFFQIIAGIGGGPVVALYGLRTNFLHLPLIFVIPQVFSYEDVVKVGRWILVLSIPMTGLMIWQFMSPPNSWINASTMADTQQISFAAGKIRPAGTFSFATGPAQFFALTAVFVIYGLTQPRAIYSRWLVGGALLSLIVVQPVSGSRLLVLGCALIALAAIVFAFLNPRRSQRILAVAALVGAVFAVLSLNSFFREAMTVFMIRWNDASVAGTSLTDRVLGGFLDPFAAVLQVGLLGMGVGMGTNAASALMTGTLQFLLAEGEWSRVVLEAGPLLGFSFLAYRLYLAGDIAVRAAFAAKQQNLLAWLLAWQACRGLINEQISQPTNLGFMVFVCGLCLAAIPAGNSVPATVRPRGGQQPLQSRFRFESRLIRVKA